MTRPLSQSAASLVVVAMLCAVFAPGAQAAAWDNLFLGESSTPEEFKETIKGELSQVSVDEIKAISEFLSECDPVRMISLSEADIKNAYDKCLKPYNFWKMAYYKSDAKTGQLWYQEQLSKYKSRYFGLSMTSSTAALSAQTYTLLVRLGDKKATAAKKDQEKYAKQRSDEVSQLNSFVFEFTKLLQKSRS